MHRRPGIEAKPLDKEKLCEMFLDPELSDLIVEVDHKLYNVEDLDSCNGCELLAINRLEFNDEGLCDWCAQEAEAEAKHVAELISDYYASRL